MPDAIVTAPGSLGDVNPLLAIAGELQASGMDVVFAAAERYLSLAERAGLRTRVLTSEKDFSRLVRNPHFWHPRRGARLILREGIRDSLEPHYEWLKQTCRPGKTLLVSHLLDFAGRIYRDRYPETPMATVVLAPSVLRSLKAPPRISGFGWERRLPRRLYAGIYRAADLWVDWSAGPPINRLRKSLGLSPVRRIIDQWWLSPDLILGMFPDWFSLPAEDLPAHFRHAGFPLADSRQLVDEQTTAELEKVLQSLDGDRPLVIAPGTAHHHAGEFLKIAAEACGHLARPAVLLSTEPSQIPSALPPKVIAARYLPFSRLLPAASGIVHHGGVGTTSQSFQAALPQVVLPMAFDQFDNGERVERLGCGVWLPMQKLNRQRLVSLLDGLETRTVSRTAVADRIKSSVEPASRLAANLLRQLAAGRS